MRFKCRFPTTWPTWPWMIFICRFNNKYRELYHYVPDHTPIELLTWRVRVSGMRAPLAAATLPEADAPAASKGRRRVYFAEAGGFADAPIYDRYRLLAGMQFTGPAIVEERESTIVVDPGTRATVDRYGNLHLDLGEASKGKGE